MKRPRMDVYLEELDQIIERGTRAPLSAPESEAEADACMRWRQLLPQPRTTEKTKDVLEQSAAPTPKSSRERLLRKSRATGTELPPTVAPRKLPFRIHLHAGDPCPGCEKGKVYPPSTSGRWCGIVGQVHRWQPRSTRWNGCDAATRAGKYRLRRKSRARRRAGKSMTRRLARR